MEETFNQVVKQASQFVGNPYQYSKDTLTYVQESFQEHPNAVNQDYLEHLCDAMRYGWTACVSGGAFMVHSVFPFMFQDTGSSMIKELNDKLQAKRAILLKQLNPESTVEQVELETKESEEKE